MKRKYLSNQIQRKLKIVLLGVILVFVAVMALEKYEIINLISDKKIATSGARTTSNAPTAQDDFTDGGPRQPANTNRNEGTIKDTGGQINNTPAQAQWTTSADKKITLYSPTKGSVVKNGDALSGQTSLSQVSFRLIDDVSGVIAQGALSVVDGMFSGNFNFSTTATNGRIDVFSVNSDGTESSNVEIPIRFR